MVLDDGRSSPPGLEGLETAPDREREVVRAVELDLPDRDAPDQSQGDREDRQVEPDLESGGDTGRREVEPLVVEQRVTDVEESWDEDGNLNFSFKALGFEVSGQMVTCDSQVTVAGNLPFAALPFRGAIESEVKQRLQEAIES